ncbi:glycosyltransferase [Streptomyces sp. AV19]|uniref:glycosyltransferase n=1 Tax=Streptomyces sp. AV19 TaxID=2793068 RepID=UPI0018FECB7C|nr:glycosyltransferase [Streptomyces sp. AV19]MBH1935327.1 glycosyltransferase [Streptomyces sp. AV19]MDG4531213.1 glycosyltransferase [Streptomyces sp. AV19]
MLVNVVTAVHAPHAVFLPAAWESLRRQSHGDWGWLVQIDGPADAVLRALADCGAARDDRVDVAANGTGEGPAVTRNVALGRAEAELVQNADADDELEPDALALLAGALAGRPRAGFAVGHARDLLPGGALRRRELPLGAGTLPRGALLDAWSTGGEDGYRLPVHPAGVMWRRSLLLALGGWSALHGMEDTGLLMAASATAEGVLVDAPTLRYRKHPGQLSARRDDFAGGGLQIELVRQRAAVLRTLPGWAGPAVIAHCAG